MTASKLKFAGLLVFILSLTAFTDVQAQVTTWKFDSANNNGMMVQITTSGSDEEVTKVELGKKGDAAWTQTDIQHRNYEETYLRVKSKGSGRVYELTIDWYDGKLVQTLPEGTTYTYWLRQ